MRTTISLIITLFIQISVFSQNDQELWIMKKLKADQCISDSLNGDGVYKVRNKKTMKWGMIQSYSRKIGKIIPMEYDSLYFFPVNGLYTAVYKNGKLGFYLSEWSYAKKAKQSVPCIYESYKTIDISFDNMTLEEYLAVKKNGKWGWVDFYTGEEKSEFIYEHTDDLPKPDWKSTYY